MRTSGDSSTPLKPIPAVVWHDLECGAARDDLRVWAELASEAGGSVLELGCGTGRVGLHLARAGHEVIGIDESAALVAAFNERAREEELNAQAIVADARELHLRRRFSLIVAPMQMIQLLEDGTERLAALRSMTDHLDRDAKAALAIVEAAAIETGPGAGPAPDPLPDIRELHGWVFSSLHTDTRTSGRGIVVERLRERVSPQGERFTEQHSDHLVMIDADRLEEEAGLCHMRALERRETEPADGFARSTVVVLEMRP